MRIGFAHVKTSHAGEPLRLRRAGVWLLLRGRYHAVWWQ